MCYPEIVPIKRLNAKELLKKTFLTIGYRKEAAEPAEECAFLASFSNGEFDQLRYNYIVQRLIMSLRINGTYLLKNYTLPDLTFVPSHHEARFSEGMSEWTRRHLSKKEMNSMIEELTTASESVRQEKKTQMRCKFCKSTNVVTYRRQTRGGDEAFTEFTECIACKKHYR
jgi:DNA-directed RNA polymerase subunit M/transcription elongation factor TFIIS